MPAQVHLIAYQKIWQGIKFGRFASTGVNINLGGRPVDLPQHQIKFLAKFSGYIYDIYPER